MSHSGQTLCVRVMFKAFVGGNVFGLSEQSGHLGYLVPDFRFDFLVEKPEDNGKQVKP